MEFRKEMLSSAKLTQGVKQLCERLREECLRLCNLIEMGKASGPVDLDMASISGRMPMLNPRTEKGSPWPSDELMLMWPNV